MPTRKQYFHDNGYTIVKSLIPKFKIDNLLNQFELFKKNNKLYYSQSVHNWRRTSDDINQDGFLTNSILDFTYLTWAQKMGSLGEQILLSEEVLSVLQEIGANEKYSMWQNMFFDNSTGTIDHFDSWYLDTNPPGSLIGVWVALEDIDEANGTFHIYPKSHKACSDVKQVSHDDFKNYCVNLSKSFTKYPAKLSKGDCLFWHPNLIHGSSHQGKKGYSRKSLTAHYQPSSFKRSNAQHPNGVSENISLSSSQNLPILTINSYQKFKFSLKGYIKSLTQFKNKESMNMKR